MSGPTINTSNSSGTNFSALASWTFNVTGVAAGDTILLFILNATNANPTLTPTSVADGQGAYTLVAQGTSAFNNNLMIYALTAATAGTHAVTVTFASAVTGGVTWSTWSNAAGSVVNSGAGNYSAALAGVASQAVSATAGDTVVSFTSNNGTAVTAQTGTAWFNGGGLGTGVVGQYQTAASTGTVIPSFTMTGATFGETVAVSLTNNLGNQAEASNAAASSISATVNSLANDDILVAVAYNPGGGTITLGGVNDGLAYTKIGSTVVSGANKNIALYLLQSVSAGSHTPVFSVVGGSTSLYMAVKSISGFAAPDGTNGADIPSAVAGANTLNSGSITTALSGDAIYSFFAYCSGTLTTPSAGTSPNAFTSDGLTTAGYLLQHFTQPAAGAITPTAGTANAGEYVGISVALAAAVAPSTALLGQIMM